MDDEPQTGDVQQHFITCDAWMCGTNSPQIANLGFWELNAPTLTMPGRENNAGLRVLHFRQGSGLYMPRVFRGRLAAMPTSSVAPNNVPLHGAALIGGYFLLTIDGPAPRYFKLKVSEVGSIQSWAKQSGGGAPLLETYKLDWTEIINGLGGDFRNVCKSPGGRDEMGMNGALAFHTLLFEGDRIDAARKLDTAVDTSWFNLGCAGSALAKMALTGHTEAALNAHTFTTTVPERQTMLKMLTADYCDSGKPFTVTGQPLNWADDAGTMKMKALSASPPRPLVLEARWSPSGAVCLNKPRVDVHWTSLGDATFGSDVYTQVLNHCGAAKMPPVCSDLSFDPAGYHLVSATEPFQPAMP